MKDLRNNKGGSSSGPGENVYSKEEVDALIDNIGEIAQGTYTNTDRVTNDIIDGTVAKPSSPSVKLTAFDEATITSIKK